MSGEWKARGGVGELWNSYPHQELYDFVRTNAEGRRAATDAEAEIDELLQLMIVSAADIDGALNEAGVEWTGAASASVRDGVAPLNEWNGRAAEAGKASQGGTADTGATFEHVANTMPEPVPAPSKMAHGIPATITGAVQFGQLDQDAAERQSQQAHQHAVELMNQYSGGSSAAMATLGEFTPPPSVTASAKSPDSSPGTIDSADYRNGTGGAPYAGGPSGGSGGAGGGPAFGPTGGPSGSDPSGRVPATTTSAAAVPPPTPPATTTPSALPGSAPGGPAAHPFAPVSGVLNNPGGGSRGTGYGSGAGGPGGVSGVGRSPGGLPGAGGAPGSGAVPGRGGFSAGAPGGAGAPGAPGATAASGAARGGAGGFGPMGAGAGGRDEDKERTAPEYLRDYRDDFWDDTPPVAPPTIGVDDD